MTNSKQSKALDGLAWHLPFEHPHPFPHILLAIEIWVVHAGALLLLSDLLCWPNVVSREENTPILQQLGAWELDQVSGRKPSSGAWDDTSVPPYAWFLPNARCWCHLQLLATQRPNQTQRQEIMHTVSYTHTNTWKIVLVKWKIKEKKRKTISLLSRQ